MTEHHDVVYYLIEYWWLALIFGGGALNWVADTFDTGVNSWRKRVKRKRKHQLALARLELQIAQAAAHHDDEPAPGPCRHRKAVPVRNNDGDVLAWLCRSCDTQLPADFSIYKEDL